MNRLKQAWLALDWDEFENGVMFGGLVLILVAAVAFVAMAIWAVPLIGAVLGFLLFCGLIAVAKGKRSGK